MYLYSYLEWELLCTWMSTSVVYHQQCKGWIYMNMDAVLDFGLSHIC